MIGRMTDPKVLEISLPTPFFEGTSNAYLLLGEPLTLVDTGIGGKQSLTCLEFALKEAGFALSEIPRILLTHKHADHMGLARTIQDRAGCTVFVHESDREQVTHFDERDQEWGTVVLALLRKWGTAEEQLAKAEDLVSNRLPLGESVAAEPLRNGQMIPMENGDIEVIHSPGHTKGSVCFRWEHRLFTGDHVLPTITPNIGIGELGERGMLQQYFRSLEAARGQQSDDLMVFPGHGQPFRDLAGRCTAIRQHHLDRLAAIRQILSSHGASSVFNLARELFGELRDFHLLLGCAEAWAHLDYLETHGAVVKDSGRYHLTDGPLPRN